MNTAKAFANDVNPFRKKHVVKAKKQKGLFGEDTWYEKKQSLTNKDIGKALIGKKDIGCFNTRNPQAFALDIDDHINKYTDPLDSPVIKAKLKRVYEYFPEPTYFFKTTRGVHLWYLLKERIPIKVLIESFKYYSPELLRLVELKPTHKTALRISATKNLVSSGDKYNYSELFNGFNLYDASFDHEGYERKRSILGKSLNHIEFTSGFSNEAYCKAVAILYSKGFNEEEATETIRQKLFADGYQGGLHSTLVTRVRSSYYNLENGRFSEFISVTRQLSIDQVNKSNMFEFMASGNRSDRRKNLVGLFQHVLLWIAYIDEIKDDPLEKDYFNFLFPYFSQRVDNGFYPLSRAYMRKYSNNNRLIRAFFEILHKHGVITEVEGRYSSRDHICKYYKFDFSKINDDDFSKIMGEKTSTIARLLGKHRMTAWRYKKCNRTSAHITT